MIDILAVGHTLVLGICRRPYRALAKRGWTIEMAASQAQLRVGGGIDPREADDPPLHMLPLRGTANRKWTFDGIGDLIRQRRPKIVILENEPESRMGIELGTYAHEVGAKLICLTNENDIPAPLATLLQGDVKRTLRSIRSRTLSLVARHRVDHVLAISKGGVKAMEAMGFAGRVTQIPLGFDRKLFRPFDEDARAAARAKLGVTKPAIAYFGRLVPEKGVHVLIQALGALRDCEWQFLLDDFTHGHNTYLSELKQAIADVGIGPRTIFHHTSHDEMPSVMNAADIVVVPSVWREQYCRIVPEAMACGRAVIISDIGAMPELLGGCGVAVPSGDASALRDAIRAQLGDPVRRMQLGERAVTRAHAELSLDSQTDITDALIRRLIPSQSTEG